MIDYRATKLYSYTCSSGKQNVAFFVHNTMPYVCGEFGNHHYHEVGKACVDAHGKQMSHDCWVM